MQSFIEEFHKQAFKLGISLDSPETVIKHVGALHSYIKHSLLLFGPTTIDAANVKAIHLESRGKNDREDQAKKTPFKPQHGKFQKKGKGKDKKSVAAKKGDEATSSCTLCKKYGHDEDHCWKLHPELRPKRFNEEGK